jgi:hypothetical protein
MIDQTKTNGSMSDKADAAFEQATTKIVERARQTGTPVVVWEDDHVAEISPERAETVKPKTDAKK